MVEKMQKTTERGGESEIRQKEVREGKEWVKNKQGSRGRKAEKQEKEKRSGETWKEKVGRFYFGQDLIWSQVSCSQHQSSLVNHHPSGRWHSERPGSNLCRSSDLSTHNSISSPPRPLPKIWAAVPTKPLQDESSMSEIYFHLISRSTSCGFCYTVNSL